MYTEIAQMIRAIHTGDKTKGLAYAKLLVENLEKDGQYRGARIISRALDADAPKGNAVCFDDDTSLTA